MTEDTVDVPSPPERVVHPPHYGGGDNPYEVIKIIYALKLNFSLGNAFKYIARAGKKTPDPIEDLKKARQYIDFEIEQIQNRGGT